MVPLQVTTKVQATNGMHVQRRVFDPDAVSAQTGPPDTNVGQEKELIAELNRLDQTLTRVR